jgi:hypothetical protein
MNYKTGWSPTYYLGQYGIAIGFLRERAERKAE